MQELISTFHLYQNSASTYEEQELLSFYIKCAEDLLEKEKEQIKDAWDAGMSEGIGTTMADLDWDGDFTNYLNETYNQNK